MEPLNKGHHGTNDLIPCREVVHPYIGGQLNNMLKYKHGDEKVSLVEEVVLISEGPLSEVPLYSLCHSLNTIVPP